MHKQGVLLLLSLAASQAQNIDSRVQIKDLDFTSAPATKPLKAGTVLPPTCGLGELFFKTNAAAGANVYACVAANTWVVQGVSSGGSTTIDTNGMVVGQRGTVNYVPGLAVLNVVSDTGTQINVQHSVDTAIVQTQTGAQSGSAELCASTSGSTSNYTCAMTPTLQQLYTNMVLHWKPDTNGAGGATTLNIDTLGPTAIKLADGATDPTASDIRAGRLYDIWYDGASFRLKTPAVVLGFTGVRPGCDVTQRGRLWQTFGATGIQDTVAVCAKDAMNAYAWRPIY